MVLRRLKEDCYSLHTSYVYLLFPFLVVLGYILAFYLHLPWTIVFLVYGVIPKLDQILRHDWLNPSSLSEIQQLENNQKFRAVLYFSLFMDWVVFLQTMRVIYYGWLSPL